MTELDDAIEQHMAYLVISERRPFCYFDFLCFEIDEKEYTASYGTIRNKFSQMKKQGKIVVHCNSKPVFYSLSECKIGKSMTVNPTGVSNAISNNHPIYNMLKNLPMDKACIHDIHLNFKAPNIYENFSTKTPYPKIEGNKAIVVPSWIKNNAITKVTINKNDTVTIIIGCSADPVPINYVGIIRFFTILARSEAFLQGLMVTNNKYQLDQTQSIPSYGKWTVTRWDFGRDALVSYKGPKYEITVENAQHMFARIYVKEFNKDKRIRAEIIECPRKNVFDAIQEKLNVQIL